MDYSNFEKRYTVSPSELENITNYNSIECAKCGNLLTKNIIQKTQLDPDGNECKSCRSYWSSGNCSCTTITIDWLYINCKTCTDTKVYYQCIDCKEVVSCKVNDMCDYCQKANIRPVRELNWNNMSLDKKLTYYGKSKLRQLAKIHKINNYMNLGKGGLLKSLSQVVCAGNLPIKFLEPEENFLNIVELLELKDLLYLRKLAKIKNIENFIELDKSEIIKKLFDILTDKSEIILITDKTILGYINDKEFYSLIIEYLDYHSILYLRKLATFYKIRGRSSMNKNDLVYAISYKLYKFNKLYFIDEVKNKKYNIIFESGKFKLSDK